MPDLNVGYAEVGAGRRTGRRCCLHGWPYDIHSYADVAPLLAYAGLPRDRAVRRGLRHDTLPVERHDPQRPAGGARGRRGRPDGCARDRPGDRRRLRLGRSYRQRRRRALARPVQGDRLGERLPDRQPGGGQAAAAARGRAPVVVPVLLRDRTRPRGLREEPARLRQADLAARVAEVGLRRCHVRSQRGGVRQPGPRRDRDPQLPLAARPGRRRGAVRRPRAPTRGGSRHHGPHDHARRRRERRAASGAEAYAKRFTGSYAHRTITGGIGHNLPQEAPEAFADAVVDVDAF